MVSSPEDKIRNRLAYAMSMKESADMRLRALMASAPREILDELIRAGGAAQQAPQPDHSPEGEPPPPPEPAEPEPEPEPEPQPAAVTLDAETLARIRREAKAYVAQQLAERDQHSRRDLEQRVKEDIIAELRRDAGLASHLDDIVEYTLNCPPFADRFIIDGVEYHHGYTYHMRRSLYDLLREAVSNGWRSEDLAGNPNRKFHRRPEQRSMLPLYREAEDGHIVSRETQFSALGGGVRNAPVNNNLAGGLPARGRAA